MRRMLSLPPRAPPAACRGLSKNRPQSGCTRETTGKRNRSITANGPSKRSSPQPNRANPPTELGFEPRGPAARVVGFEGRSASGGLAKRAVSEQRRFAPGGSVFPRHGSPLFLSPLFTSVLLKICMAEGGKEREKRQERSEPHFWAWIARAAQVAFFFSSLILLDWRSIPPSSCLV